MVAAAEGGDEQRAEPDDRDRDQDREPTPASILLLAAISQRHGTP
jgi:hypothetical protein